jgi:putative phage-type endonuclease
MNREEFLKIRKEFIGASDIGSLFDIEPYGCRRRLYFDKSGATPDFDLSEKPELKRGQRLEKIASDYYEEKTGRQVFPVEQKKHKHLPRCGASGDRLVFDDGRPGPGLLELKVVGTGSFFKILKNGLPEEYISQLQYAIAVYGLKWGSFGIYCPEKDGLYNFDVDFDEKLAKVLLTEADTFWQEYIHTRIVPERKLPPDSKACAGCQFKSTCESVEKETITF